MRLPLLAMAIIIIINLMVDCFMYVRLRKSWCNPMWARTQLWSAIACYLYFVVIVLMPHRTVGNSSLVVKMWLLYGYFTLYIPKYIYSIFTLVSLTPELFRHKSWKWLSLSGAVIGAIVFVALWWGALVTRYNIQVNHVTVHYTNLPASFDGYRVVQFSDFHVGSYGKDTTFVNNVIDSINALHPDLIVFTGDIVNRETDELIPFVTALSRLRARDGVYSILGNHDYGDYRDWQSPQAKADNMKLMYALQKKMGWHMLNNAHVMLHSASDSIALIGVENWGDPPFKTYGNLHKAYSNLNDSVFKILLTHNPAHWKAEVLPETNIDLSLSGHTHAMQTMIGGFSPAEWRYEEWGGLYEEKRQQLYVNIGLGEVGIPSRIGATPEITLITLKNGK